MDVLINLISEDLKIIGQSADKAIIFCYHEKKRRIVCFDQHAADERIRFEQLLDNKDHIEEEDLDQIKSRACHGAIRFGDKLTMDQCQELIDRLLKCKVPFKCAHSRQGVCVLDSLDKVLFVEKIRRAKKKNPLHRTK